MRLKILGPIRLERKGEKSASDQLKEMILEKSKEIKLTVPFEASGTFEKQPLQPDGVTPVEVKKPDFESVKLESKVEEVKSPERKEEKTKKEVKVEKTKLKTKKRK
jgi:hypothetical protein